jgi:hypothetical protein
VASEKRTHVRAFARQLQPRQSPSLILQATSRHHLTRSHVMSSFPYSFPVQYCICVSFKGVRVPTKPWQPRNYERVVPSRASGDLPIVLRCEDYSNAQTKTTTVYQMRLLTCPTNASWRNVTSIYGMHLPAFGCAAAPPLLYLLTVPHPLLPNTIPSSYHIVLLDGILLCHNLIYVGHRNSGSSLTTTPKTPSPAGPMDFAITTA